MEETADYVPEFVDCTAGFDCTTGFVDYLADIQIKVVPSAYTSAEVFEKVFAEMLAVEMFVAEVFVAEVFVVFFT